MRERTRTLLASFGLAAVACGGAAAPPQAEDPGPPPNSSAASCVETFSPQSLRDRAFAFDGTVLSIEPRQDPRLPPGEDEVPWVTFDVNRWYAGGQEARVGVWIEDSSSSPTISSVDSIAVEEGARLLVSGEPRWGGRPLDDPIAWSCGFTEPWTEEAAADWDRAFGH
jgi:hypothetical protein